MYSVNLTVFQELMKWFYDCGLVKETIAMKKNKLFWILTVVCVLNFAAHLYFYPSLPDIVPTTESQRAGQRLRGEIHDFVFGRDTVCHADYV